MSGDNMDSGAGSKRKESSVNEDVPSSRRSKRTKATITTSRPETSRQTDIESESDGIDVIPTIPAVALANLKALYNQERDEYEHEIDELRAKLAVSKKNEDKWRIKYKNELDDLVEEKTEAAEKRVSEAEAKVKQVKIKAKQDIVNIRAELVAVAKEAAVEAAHKAEQADPQYPRSPDPVFRDAMSALKTLNRQDPKRYSDLVKLQPDYEQLEARSKAKGPDIQQTARGPVLEAADAVSSTKQALKDLHTDLVNASEDMRTNSTLANQKKTLCKKMDKALKEVEPIFLAHAERAQGKAQGIKPPASPTADQSKLVVKHQKLQFHVNELTRKLKDVRTKLDHEIKMRRGREGELAEGVKMHIGRDSELEEK